MLIVGPFPMGSRFREASTNSINTCYLSFVTPNVLWCTAQMDVLFMLCDRWMCCVMRKTYNTTICNVECVAVHKTYESAICLLQCWIYCDAQHLELLCKCPLYFVMLNLVWFTRHMMEVLFAIRNVTNIFIFKTYRLECHLPLNIIH